MEKAEQVFPDVAVVRGSAVSPTFPEAGLTRRVGAYNEKLFLAEHRMEKGWVGARHSHPHEQIVVMVEGKLRLIVGDVEKVIGPDDIVVISPNTPHEAHALEDTIVIDIFSPPREDFLAGGRLNYLE